MRPASRVRSSALTALLAMAVLVPAAFAQDEPAVRGEPAESGEDAEAARTEAARMETARIEAGARLAEAVRAREAARPQLEAGFAALEKHDWVACVEPFRAAAKALDGPALLGGLRDQCLYNIACALAHLERPDDAVVALRESLAHGIRDVAEVSGDRVRLSMGLTLAHVLSDPDLDPLRERKDFRDVLDLLVRAGAPTIETSSAVGPDASGLPAVIVLLRSDGTLDSEGDAWRAAFAETPALIAFVEGPVRQNANVRRWLLRDGDVRFGAARVGEALDLVRADPRVDPTRVVVVAAGGLAAEAAWAAVLERPQDVAALALGPARFHAAWHADALAAMPRRRAGQPAWELRLVGETPRAADLLTAAGAHVVQVPAPEPVEGASPLDRYAALRDAIAAEARPVISSVR